MHNAPSVIIIRNISFVPQQEIKHSKIGMILWDVQQNKKIKGVFLFTPFLFFTILYIS
jgi:hypothetical protein